MSKYEVGQKVKLTNEGKQKYPLLADKEQITIERLTANPSIVIVDGETYISEYYLDLPDTQQIVEEPQLASWPTHPAPTAPVTKDEDRILEVVNKVFYEPEPGPWSETPPSPPQPPIEMGLTIRSNDEDPQKYVLSVQFPASSAIDPRDRNRSRRYEYYAFGMYDELVNATHAVVTKQDHNDIDDILADETLQVVRILDVYPTSQQRYNGKLRWIVDFVDGAQYVRRNMNEQKTQQLRSEIKKRLEQLTEMRILEKTVLESGDEKAKELYRQLQELDNG